MNRSRATRKNSIRSVPNHSALWPRGRRRRTIMNRQRRILGSIAVITVLALLASACNRDDDKAVKGRNGPNGAAHDSISDLALSEEGLGQILIGMNLDDAVNMGLLNENLTMNTRCDFAFPRACSGMAEAVSLRGITR